MAVETDLRCATDRRRAALVAQRRQGRDVTGIDYIVVSADQRSLEVFFIDREPPAELVTGRSSFSRSMAVGGSAFASSASGRRRARRARCTWS